MRFLSNFKVLYLYRYVMAIRFLLQILYLKVLLKFRTEKNTAVVSAAASIMIQAQRNKLCQTWILVCDQSKDITKMLRNQQSQLVIEGKGQVCVSSFFHELLRTTFPEIGDTNFKCALWTFKQQLVLKMQALCRISIVLKQMSLYCAFQYTPGFVFGFQLDCTTNACRIGLSIRTEMVRFTNQAILRFCFV